MHLILGSDLLTVPIVGLLVGLLLCFMGKKILGFIIILFGFLIGYTWGAQVLSDVLNRAISCSPWIPWVAGVVGAALGIVAWKVSMFFAGTVIGLFIARGLFPDIPAIAHTGIALSTGILVQIYKDPVLAFSTALGGGLIAGSSIVSILRSLGMLEVTGLQVVTANRGFIPYIVLSIILTIIGYLFQTRKLND